MAKSFIPRRKRKRKATSFNPNHQFVDSAVEDYLKKGGKIQKIDSIKDSYEGFISLREQVAPADEFLLGL
ncbi:MAG: hypothetical protein COB67_01875 [SAR324 cluster bacterium]|uniref:Uncharacterized protein n=1 Tax=SAR324 cluster bacterium TaxID=2024889 RepID=A0A2A4T9Y1_9DELT|nr:MAG: hypothetical protein COB67_01875 [SAR324 cluster bacterium]